MTGDGDEREEVEPIPLAALNGAVLTWEDTDGNTHEVHFDE